jgi:toxin ParE1/3/4
MRVVFTKSARLDLISIGDWLATKDPDFAEAYVAKLSGAALKLGEMPGKGVSRPQWGADVRVWFVDRYVIAYRVKGDVVEIVRIVHGARELDRLFGAPDD